MIAPARTGRDSSSKIEVINTDHAINVMLFGFTFLGFIFVIVEIKLIAPKIDEIPAI